MARGWPSSPRAPATATSTCSPWPRAISKRLTFDDGLDQLDAWSRDGRWIYFSNGTNDVGRKNDLYRVSAEGGTPMPVSADRFTNEFQAAPAPDGTTLAFAARGNGDQQWWRHGHSHLDESEIWLRKEGAPPTSAWST